MTREEPTWIPRLVVEVVQLDQIREHGGRLGIRDANALQAALARPRERWSRRPDADLPRLSAEYATGMSENLPFRDGNRRTAILSVIVFLGLNGLDFAPSDDELVERIEDLAAGRLDGEVLAEWIRSGVSESQAYPGSPQSIEPRAFKSRGSRAE